VERAPAAVVQEAQQKSRELEEKLSIIRKRVSILEAMVATPAN
jgi:hypothetical protein